MAGTSLGDYLLGEVNGKRMANRQANEEAQAAIERMEFLEAQVKAWQARFQRERANRRGWQEAGMAAELVVQRLAKTDLQGAIKMIDQSKEENKAMLEEST